MNKEREKICVGLFKSVLVSLASFAARVAPRAYDAVRAQGGAVEITVANSSNSIPVNTARLADTLGLFEKQGLKPKFIVADSGAGSMTALLAGSVDFSTTGIDELLALRSRGQNSLAMVLNIYSGQSGIIVVSKDLAAKLPANCQTRRWRASRR